MSATPRGQAWVRVWGLGFARFRGWGLGPRWLRTVLSHILHVMILGCFRIDLNILLVVS